MISTVMVLSQGSKEGKTAWKMRKEAMDEVAAALEKCNGIISTASLKSLVELLRALKERMSDSQSNLKPVASRIIGSILSSVDRGSQAKLGKVVYASLVNAVMNDNRKPMREASLEALKVGTQLSPLEGTGPNELSLEPLMVALVGELGESELKVIALLYLFELRRAGEEGMSPTVCLSFFFPFTRVVESQTCSCSSPRCRNSCQTWTQLYQQERSRLEKSSRLQWSSV